MSIDMVQRFVVEVDSLELLEKYLRLAITTALESHEEMAVKVVDRDEKYLGLHLPPVLSDQKKHFPIIFIGGWYLPEEGKENSYFGGYPSWKTFRFDRSASTVDAAIQYIKGLLQEHGKIWGAEFKEKFGDGYDDCFNHYDGSVELGYELRSCGCFPEWLAVSIVHMYYGK